jgi:hypothetical protein
MLAWIGRLLAGLSRSHSLPSSHVEGAFAHGESPMWELLLFQPVTSVCTRPGVGAANIIR